MVLIPEIWIGDMFSHRYMTSSDGTEWRIGDKITEKCDYLSAARDEITEDLCESQAVYHCRQTTGPEVGRAVIVKIRMQVPLHYPASDNSEERAVEASTALGPYTRHEIGVLNKLNKVGSSVTPKLVTWDHLSQDESMPVPGGYLAILVMEKVPGLSLDNFWDYERQTRDKIRAAFRLAMTEFFSYSVWAGDKRLPNIHYDEVNDKCYILDYEDVEVIDSPSSWTDHEYFYWGLAYRGRFGNQEEVW